MQIEILRKKSEFLTFSIHFSRPSDGKSFEELEPRNLVSTHRMEPVFHVMGSERVLK